MDLMAGNVSRQRNYSRRYVAVMALVLTVASRVMAGEKNSKLQENNRQKEGEIITYYNAILAGLVSALVVMGLLCIWLGRKWKNALRYRKFDGIYLQIMTENLSETISLGECVMSMDQVFQKGEKDPLLLDVNIEFVWAYSSRGIGMGKNLICHRKYRGG